MLEIRQFLTKPYKIATTLLLSFKLLSDRDKFTRFHGHLSWFLGAGSYIPKILAQLTLSFATIPSDREH